MITGRIEDKLYPRILITLATSQKNIQEKVLVDTGFDYDLASKNHIIKSGKQY